MCSPLVAAQFALASLGAAATHQANSAQTAAANAQVDAQIKAWEHSVKESSKSLADQSSQEGVRVQQEQNRAAEKMLQLRRESKRSVGDVLASSVNGGLSEELIVNNIYRQEADYTDIIANNVKDVMQQSYVNKLGMVSEASSRANNSAPRGNYVSKPSFLGLGLGIAGAGLNAYNAYQIGGKTSGDIKTARK